MGESLTEATLTQWLKKPGDKVERDEALFEITTDKVDAEVPSPAEGILVEIRVQPGQTVEINHVVAVIDSAAGAAVSSAPVTSSAPAAQDVAVGKAVLAPVHAPKVEVGADVSLDELRRTKSTPLVRRIAAEHGIQDISAIPGTGLSGRVTKTDILSYIETHVAPAPAAAKPAAPAPAAAKPAGRDYQLPAVDVGARDRIEIMTPQRLSIAKHMIASRATSAHAQTVHEVDFAAVARAKKALTAEFADRGVRLTFTAFLIKAAAEALAAFPMVNSSMDGDSIVYRGDINISMAVDVGESLVVPVIKNVDELSLLGVARAVSDLAERARTKKLKPEDVKGGTFTITNPGIFGSEFGVPIINQPQTAILATGAIKKRVVVDQDTDAIMVRPTSIWCMSFDHRVIDGATADRFVLKLRQLIENYEP
jgi:2-oxoglutarate dehydrogenase E2 component (dihydrolipoamide succinyltransferase)